MSKDLKGIHRYTETDDAPTFSELLNIGMASVSDALAYFAGPSASRLALDPAPPGSMWKDTDNNGRVWSDGPDGKWRRHEGSVAVAAAGLSVVGNIYGRSVSVDLPTVLAPNETIMITATELGGSTYSWIAQNSISRQPDKTTIGIRHMSIVATAQGFSFAWRVVRGGA